MELCGSQVQLTPSHEYFINGIANPEIIWLEIFVLLDTNYNEFLILNNFLVSFKIKNAIAIAWNYSPNKKSITKESYLLNIC